MRLFKPFSIFPKRNPSPFGLFPHSMEQPGPSSAAELLANIAFSAVALTLFYFLSRPAFK
jgi:hypothetical protein